jgi:hypothetical protein
MNDKVSMTRIATGSESCEIKTAHKWWVTHLFLDDFHNILLPTAFEMLLACVLNVPHYLQASIEMTRPTLPGTGEDIFLATGFFTLTGAASFFLGRDLTNLSLTVFEVSLSKHSCV